MRIETSEKATNKRIRLTRDQMLRFWYHMSNGNEKHVISFLRDKGFGGAPVFLAAKKSLANSLEEGLECIFGGAEHPFAPVAYPWNLDSHESRWVCLDIDCHLNRESGETISQSRERMRMDDRERHSQWVAGRAFQWLHKRIEAYELTDITCGLLEWSGRGYHVWAISREFRPARFWRMFASDWFRDLGFDLAKDGIEIHPCALAKRSPSSDSKHDRGVRLPASANPSTWAGNEETFVCSELLRESRLLEFVDSLPEPSHAPSSSAGKSSVRAKDDRWLSDLINRTAIVLPRTRHEQLKILISGGVWQLGERKLMALARSQFERSPVEMRANLIEHEREARAMVSRWRPPVIEALMPGEREQFDSLTGFSRDAFLIIAAFARHARKTGKQDFPISTHLLANRVGAKGFETGRQIRRKFANAGYLRKTEEATRPIRAARFQWLLS